LASICLDFNAEFVGGLDGGGLLWIMDASINITMEPFRAFVGDKLPEEQRTLGFVMQSFFIGIGSTLANALPYILTMLGVVGIMQSGIPYSTLIAFIVGAAAFLVAVLWTVFTTDEYPPEDMEEFRSQASEGNIVSIFSRRNRRAITDMPTTMKQLAVVQFFTWFRAAVYVAVLRFDRSRGTSSARRTTNSPLFKQGTEWGGVCFAVYNFVCFLVAFGIPPLADKIGRKGVHIICLDFGRFRTAFHVFRGGPYFLWLGMAGVGIAWASILSMPYVILAGAIRPERMGVYMGVFNLFIVIPQVAQSLIAPQIYKSVLGDNPLNAVLLGGFQFTDRGGERFNR
jgi:maltose/moltooligosaccharide transporter